MIGSNDIAVAIVFFNKAEQTLEAIRCFSKIGVPVYVLNNGSAPSANAMIRHACECIENVKYIHSEINLGPGGGRNLLIQASAEPWLLFVDNDITTNDSTWLKNFQLHIEHSRNVEVFVPIIHNVWDGSRVRPVRLSIGQEGQAIFSDLDSCYTNVFPGGAALVCRSLFERIGAYDEELFAFEDFELALRAIRQGHEISVKHVNDINLLHDHKLVVCAEDQEAVAVRYSSDRVGRAHDKIEKIYGVSFDRNYKEWLDQQILEMTDANWKRRPKVRFKICANSIKGWLRKWLIK